MSTSQTFQYPDTPERRELTQSLRTTLEIFCAKQEQRNPSMEDVRQMGFLRLKIDGLLRSLDKLNAKDTGKAA